MDQEISFDTVLDENFEFNADAVQFLVDNIRLNSLSLNQPVACNLFNFAKKWFWVAPAFFEVVSGGLVQFELGQHEGRWTWYLDFEPFSKISLKPDRYQQAQAQAQVSLATVELQVFFQEIFPVDQTSGRYFWVKCEGREENNRLIFKAGRDISTFSDALEVFDEFYAEIVEILQKADLAQIKAKSPEAFGLFNLLNKLTTVRQDSGI